VYSWKCTVCLIKYLLLIKLRFPLTCILLSLYYSICHFILLSAPAGIVSVQVRCVIVIDYDCTINIVLSIIIVNIIINLSDLWFWWQQQQRWQQQWVAQSLAQAPMTARWTGRLQCPPSSSLRASRTPKNCCWRETEDQSSRCRSFSALHDRVTLFLSPITVLITWTVQLDIELKRRVS